MMKFLRRLLTSTPATASTVRAEERAGQEEPLCCRRCGRAVIASKALFHDVFEQMHAFCFHLEFEHDGDPDVPCLDTACQAANNVFLEQLSAGKLWEDGFTTISYTEAELETYLKQPSFLGPEDVRKIIRQARFATYLARELLRHYPGTSNDAIVRIAKTALGSEEPAG